MTNSKHFGKKLWLAFAAIMTVALFGILFVACGGGGESETKHKHSYKVTTVDPTCTEQGYDLHTCSCGKSYNDNYVNALGHDIVHAAQVLPSCKEKGRTAYDYCSRGDYQEQSQDIDKVAHSYDGDLCATCGDFNPLASATAGLAFSELKINGEIVGYSVTKGSADTSAAVKIPAEHNGKPVTHIAAGAFSDCADLTAVYIPDSVTTIGSNAFYNCVRLYNITIPQSVTSIQSNAFQNCFRLTKVINLTSMEMARTAANPGNLGVWALDLNSDADSACRVITSEDYVFYKDTRGDYYLIDYVGDSAELSLPQDIENNAYAINGYAFFNNAVIEQVVLPDTLTDIGTYAFLDCDNLQYNEYDDVKYLGTSDNNKYALIAVEDKEITSFEFSEHTRLIGGAAFNGTDIESIEIPDYIISVGDSAFEYCVNLVSVKLPKNIKAIRPYTFMSCGSLETIEIPESVQYIDEASFMSCYSMLEITIPKNVKQIATVAFAGCGRLIEVRNLSSINLVKGSMENGYAAYYAHKIMTDTDTTSLVYDGDYVWFSETDGLYLMDYRGTSKDVYLPARLNDRTHYIVHDYCFTGSGIESLKLDESVMISSEYAFYNCYTLIDVTCYTGQLYYFSSVPMIKLTISGGWLFFDCYLEFGTVEQLTLDASLDWAGGYADFSAFSDLKNLYYTGSLKDWLSIMLSAPEHAPTQFADNIYIDGALITDVVIPDTVTKVNDFVFYGYDKLGNVTVPTSVTDIGRGAFAGGTADKEIRYGGSLSEWIAIRHGNAAFPVERLNSLYINGEHITELVVPDTVDYVADYAFQGLDITSARLPADATVGYGVLNGCTNIESISLPLYDTRIDQVFYTKEVLPTDSIPHSLTTVEISTGSIGYEAFYGMNYIVNIIIKGGVSSIGERAFYNCRGLESVTIESGMTAVSASAFENCNKLSDISIADSVISFGLDVFKGCSALSFTTYDGAKYLGNEDNPYHILISAGDATVTIHPDTKVIGEYAFSGHRDLESITLPEGLLSIGYSAFSFCLSLTELEIPSSVMYVDYVAFPDFDVMQYNEYQGAKYLGNAQNPYHVLVTGGEDTASIHADTKVIAGGAFIENRSLDKIEIPDGVVSMGYLAFANCTNVTEIVIPDSVTIIGDDAFNGCLRVTSIIIGDGITSINNIKFNSWFRQLKSVSIGNGVRYIPNNAFYGFEQLTTVELGNSVTRIGEFAFSACHELSAISIPVSVTSIGHHAFEGCDALTSITIPDGVTIIGEYAFTGCHSLENVVIGSGVTHIADWAFHNCNSLSSITIPENVTSMGRNVFIDCSVDLIVYCEAAERPAHWHEYWADGLNVVWDCKN